MKPLVKSFKAGTALFHENDRSRELYIILSGNVKIYKVNENSEIEIVWFSKSTVFTWSQSAYCGEILKQNNGKDHIAV